MYSIIYAYRLPGDFSGFPFFCLVLRGLLLSLPPVSRFFHILPDYLHMLLDCFVKAPGLRFAIKDLSCTMQTLEHVLQHNKTLASLKTRKSENSKKPRPRES